MERSSGIPKGGRADDARSAMTFEPHDDRADRVGVDGTIVRRPDGVDRATKLQKQAARLQHAMNNPLAALLAEGQLLSMENDLSAEQRESVDRMIELTRRVIVLVRDMDELRGGHPPR